MSSTCRTENSTIASFAGATPRAPTVALCHHCSRSRNACASRLNGELSHSDAAKRRSLWLRLDQGPRSITGFGAVKRRFENPASGPHCVCVCVCVCPARFPSVAVVPLPDARPSQNRPANAQPERCRRSDGRASHETRDRPDRPRSVGLRGLAMRLPRAIRQWRTRRVYQRWPLREQDLANFHRTWQERCFCLWQGCCRLHGELSFSSGMIGN
jgi:hypothetical protein